MALQQTGLSLARDSLWRPQLNAGTLGAPGSVMHVNQQSYRELHEAMLSRGGEDFGAKSLAAWLARNRGEIEWLRRLGERFGAGDRMPDEDLWRLYAMSRVIQLITLPFQTGSADGSTWRGPSVTSDDLSSFAHDLGLRIIVPAHFCSFDCEIVTAVAALDPDEPPTVRATHWPCLMLGEMLVCRAGTSICAGGNVIDAQISASSTLYWAYRRKTRPYQDLSHGWGSNSQWRTAFRRDYRIGQRRFFNVDGQHDLASEDLASDEDALTRKERIELLTNRCFITTAKPSDDLWPYDDRLTLET